MGLREQLAADMAAAIAGYAQTFEWGGRDYPCVRRDTPTMLEFQDAGGVIESDRTWIVVSKSVFPAGLPALDDLVDAGSRQIKKINGANDPGAAQLTLETGSIDR